MALYQQHDSLDEMDHSLEAGRTDRSQRRSHDAIQQLEGQYALEHDMHQKRQPEDVDRVRRGTELGRTDSVKSHETDSESDQSATELDALSPRQNHEDSQRTTSNLQALMNLLKGNIGTGILALPSAFKYGGLWLGFAGIFVMGAIAVHCMHLLVKCAQHIRLRSGFHSVDYGDVMQQSFQMGPKYLQRFAAASRFVVNLFLCLTQFGFCTVYILFVADNISQVVESFTSVRIAPWLYKLMVAGVLLPYLAIRQLKLLAWFSMFANVLMVIGLCITLEYCFHDLPDVSSRPAVPEQAEHFALYFGTVVFAFEGIGVVLPIEDKMKTPSSFGGWCGVINLGMTIATCLYAAVGFFGYLRFGDDVLGSLTLNLPCDRWLYASVKLIFAVAIFITYGIQFYVPIEILWPATRSFVRAQWFQNYGEYLLRFVFLVITLVLAATIPHLDLMISLVGALSSSAIALIFPPILDTVTFWSEGKQYFGRFYWKVVKNVLILVVGFVGFLVGTIFTIKSIVEAFEK